MLANVRIVNAAFLLGALVACLLSSCVSSTEAYARSHHYPVLSPDARAVQGEYQNLEQDIHGVRRAKLWPYLTNDAEPTMTHDVVSLTPKEGVLHAVLLRGGKPVREKRIPFQQEERHLQLRRKRSFKTDGALWIYSKNATCLAVTQARDLELIREIEGSGMILVFPIGASSGILPFRFARIR